MRESTEAPTVVATRSHVRIAAPTREVPESTGRKPEAPRSERRRIDRYELGELIGRGGMGAVYRAVDTKLGRTVALKTVAVSKDSKDSRDRAPRSLNLRQRFLREALAISKVEHRNVVQILDFGVTDDDTPFLVMEHLRGRDLGAVLAETEAPLPVSYVADLMLGVCAALRACHRVGIVHRDLKPGNIFLVDTETGTEVKVLDFGVSKVSDADELTREGQILGTPQYLAPEQINGKVGPESDQYALGVLIYGCLTFRLPYAEFCNAGLLHAIERGQFTPPCQVRPELPEAIDAIVKRAMQVSPTARFESVHALGQALWPLASPRAQQEWRAYYFPTTLAALSPGVAAELHHTQMLEKPAAAEPYPAGDPRIELSTKLATPRETPPAKQEQEWNRPARRRWLDLVRSWLAVRPALAALLVGTILVCTAFAVGARRSRGRRHRPEPAKRFAAAAKLPAPPIIVPISLATAARSPAAAAGSPAPRIVVPISPPAEPLVVAAPGPSVEMPAGPEENDVRPRPARKPRRVRHAPFQRAWPNIDHTGIGIPSN